MKRVVLWCAIAGAVGCGVESDDQESMVRGDGPVVVVAVNYPLAYLTERIGGPGVTVELPMDDVDPASWEPTPDEIARVQQADLILLNGAGYAKWTATATLPESKMVVTSQAAEDRYIAVESVSHTHGPAGEHSHGEVAVTTWLDPTMAIVQAEAIAGALARVRPEEARTFQDNLAELVSDLQAVDGALADAFGRFPSRIFLASHPVYQYLARRYGLDVASVHFEPDEPPSEAQWRELQTLLAGHSAEVMLWEAEPLPATRARVEALGVSVVVFAPAGNRPDSGDYLAVMRDNVTNLEEALVAVDEG